ncbi:MAG: tRNA (N6-threonylcarbamoyladenosine(37)-N6)-methyltransferase TrmO [Desulfobacteraceae bacterium]|nr:tRNA (N6-threonylcarbamoyladenosine(37)-N6)-methyltransferase TrmO [Desulfobacteraceae bacterium]
MPENINYKLESIGMIRTPYQNNAPYQPVDADGEEFYAIIDHKYVEGLSDLKKFNYIYLIFYADRISREVEMMVSPPWADGKKVGIFASRSPVRPNPLGLSIVRIKKIVENKIYTSGLDVFDKTPLLDIKPYIKDLDNKDNANYGWVAEMDDMAHLSLHIKGIPHDY